MKLNTRLATLGLAATMVLGAAAPIASADEGRDRTATYALGAVSALLFASGHKDAGLLGLGATALAGGAWNHDIARRHRDWDYVDFRTRDRYDHRYDGDRRDGERRDSGPVDSGRNNSDRRDNGRQDNGRQGNNRERGRG